MKKKFNTKNKAIKVRTKKTKYKNLNNKMTERIKLFSKLKRQNLQEELYIKELLSDPNKLKKMKKMRNKIPTNK